MVVTKSRRQAYWDTAGEWWRSLTGRGAASRNSSNTNKPRNLASRVNAKPAKPVKPMRLTNLPRNVVNSHITPHLSNADVARWSMAYRLRNPVRHNERGKKVVALARNLQGAVRTGGSVVATVDGVRVHVHWDPFVRAFTYEASGANRSKQAKVNAIVRRMLAGTGKPVMTPNQASRQMFQMVHRAGTARRTASRV